MKKPVKGEHNPVVSREWWLLGDDFRGEIDSLITNLQELKEKGFLEYFYDEYDDHIVFIARREETDEEFAERLGRWQQMKKEIAEREKKEQEHERKLYERLKKKFEPSLSKKSPSN